jgi:Tat protein secretion system quality control protein TatD with DNase activity
VLVFFANIIGNDWNKNPLTKDYFSLVIIGEIGLDLYIRLKNKTTKDV